MTPKDDTKVLARGRSSSGQNIVVSMPQRRLCRGPKKAAVHDLAFAFSQTHQNVINAVVENLLSPPTFSTCGAHRFLLIHLTQWIPSGSSPMSRRYKSLADFRESTLARLGKMLKPPGLFMKVRHVIGGGDDAWATVEMKADAECVNGMSRFDFRCFSFLCTVTIRHAL